jgi:hypothetical protein
MVESVFTKEGSTFDMGSRVRIQLNFVVEFHNEVPPLGNLIDGFEGAIRGLYPDRGEDFDCTIEPEGRATFTRQDRVKRPKAKAT